MPDPGTTTLAVAALATSIVGTGIAAVGQIQQGQAAQAQATYQAAVLRNNEVAAQRAAEDARARGEVAAQRRAMETRKLIGRQKAVLAGNGVAPGSESAVQITSDTGVLGQIDQETIRNNAEREAIAYKSQGANFAAERQLALLRGDNAASAGMTGAFGTLITGIGSVAGKWYDFATTPSPAPKVT